MKPEYVKTIIQLALAEDIGEGDITTDNLVPSNSRSKARLISKSDGIICGVNLAREVFKALNSKIIFRPLIKDGQAVHKGSIIAEISGPTRALLSGERVALNLLSFLSGIATQTRLFVKKIKPYKAAIMDTRKTTPLLRQLQRYAVRTGGGVNHRFNLNDMALVKDNHRVACGARHMNEAISTLRKRTKEKIEVEVDDLNQLKEILDSKVDIILLDNMTPKQVAQAVYLRQKAKSRVLLEASGGITIKNIRQYAAAGVDRISVGALTHSHRALDISMEFIQTSTFPVIPVIPAKAGIHFLFLFFTLLFISPLWAQDQDDINQANISSGAIFDDRALLEGYTQKYANEPMDILLAMIADDSLGEYKCTAAVRVFKEKYADEVLSNEKSNILRILIRRLNRSDSPFVQVEIMHTLVVLDRYDYFESMVPILIQKMDHYNPVVSTMAYDDLLEITKDSLYPREARIVFETLRKIFFLSRNRLQNITTPDLKLQQKLDLMRWSIRILGTQELKRLPSEVINLL